MKCIHTWNPSQHSLERHAIQDIRHIAITISVKIQNREIFKMEMKADSKSHTKSLFEATKDML